MKIIIYKTHWNVPECNNKFPYFDIPKNIFADSDFRIKRTELKFSNHKKKFSLKNKFKLKKSNQLWISKWFSQSFLSFLPRWFALHDLVVRETCAVSWPVLVDYHHDKWFCYGKKWPRSNEENMDDLHKDLNVPCMQSITHRTWFHFYNHL